MRGAGWTPGPWRAMKWERIGGGHVFEIQAPSHELWVAVCAVSSDNTDDVEIDANTRLIAEAPAMAEVLRELEQAARDHANKHGCSGNLGARLSDARAILSRIDGE